MPKTAAKKATVNQPARQLRAPVRRFWRPRSPRPANYVALPNAFTLFIESLKIFKTYWKVFVGIMVVYGLLTLVFVPGLSGGSDLGQIKDTIQAIGNPNQLATSATLFLYLLGASGSAKSEVAGLYQVILTVIASLAIIWTLRQAYAGNTIRIRDGFYRGMYPLVPFLLVFSVVVLQLLPAVVGSYLYSTASSNGLLVHGASIAGWGLAVIVLSLGSLYMLASSLIALYIVCLPDMQPMAALRSARMLVRGRRFEVMRKILFLPFALFVLLALVMIPLIIVLASIAAWIFFASSIASLFVIHGYLYYLYRTLLQADDTNGEG